MKDVDVIRKIAEILNEFKKKSECEDYYSGLLRINRWVMDKYTEETSKGLRWFIKRNVELREQIKASEETAAKALKGSE